MDSVFEKVYPQSKIEETPAALVEKGEIPFQTKVPEGFCSVNIPSTLFTIEEHIGDSNRIAHICYLRFLLHKGITHQLIKLCFPASHGSPGRQKLRCGWSALTKVRRMVGSRWRSSCSR